MKNRLIIAAGCCIALAALAGPIKTWQAGEVITANDINANFQHIHNLMVGGHGARLVNADVNANAGIAHSKLATPALLPRIAAIGGTPSAACTSGTCALTNLNGIASIVHTGTTGTYTVTFSAARANATYAVSVTPQTNLVAYCRPLGSGYTTSTFTVECYNTSGVLTNSSLFVAVYDDNP